VTLLLPTATALPVSAAQALAFRLHRQHLITPAACPLAVAGTLLGAQAQVHGAGLLQIRARSTQPVLPWAEGALYRDRTLVKLWAQRSTLHLVPTADLPLVLALRGLMVQGYHRWYERDGLSPEQVERLVTAIADALASHGPHSRMDLSRRLVPLLGDWARPWLEHSWGGVIKLACALGHVCHGPPARTAGEGGEREALFVHLPGWAGPVPPPDRDQAMDTLLRRYLAAYGPATVADARKFFGVTTEPVRAALDRLGPALLPVDLDGRPAWALAGDEEALRQAEPPPGHITVLPLFDPWLLAHADTDQHVDPAHRKAVYRTAGWISAVVLRQGRVVATWTHRRQGDGWRVEVQPLVRLFKKEHAPIRRALRHLAGGAAVDMLVA